MKTAATLAAVVLLLAAGALHGVWSERWNRSEDLERAAALVADVPLRVGDWEGKDVQPDADEFDRAGARAFWMRSYVHARTKASVLAILMCGRAGKMAVHTPEVCYRGAGYELFDTPAATPFGESGTLFAADFSKPADSAAGLRLYWAWNAGDGWQAPTNPRWEFRGRPFLYKLYVASDLRQQGNRPTSPAQDFLNELLPELRRALSAPAPIAGRPDVLRNPG